ncbi:SGNH/GDSL hydrolase family protein [Ancylobacter pratisalsi]|uniref:SGNH/GDSL hydrolase family protein n=1 Tax=Ancylobacter pratisalsi TaxID=1745854 RepID=A0A6P1YWT0_9HYPH|nr:SGNH/GDSL hydrolase family protein [Ancylobacter pratisalsi]
MTGGSLAQAAKEPVCAAPSALTQARYALPRLAKSLRTKTPTTILVLNSAKGSKPGSGKDAIARSFPSFIEETLRERYPDGGIVLTTRSQPRATAQAILAVLPKLLAQTRPALMIWQTGTYDAILGADTSAFSDAVDAGVDLAHAAGTDVLVVSPQYSPRTAFAFDVAPYTSALHWAARAAQVPFFDRYDMMRFWDQEGIFDFDATPPSPSLFEDVHRCIGRLMVGMIVDGVEMRTLGSR